MTPEIVSIQIGLPRMHGIEGAIDPMDQPWRSGFFKEPISGPVHVGKLNLGGDGQADLKSHGGTDKAILCYSADHYPYWKNLLNLTVFPHGAFGENLTIAGLDEQTIFIGDVWQIGDVQIQVSQPRQPCWKLAYRWKIPELPEWVIENGKSGWYVRVVREGTIQAGQSMTLLQRTQEKWSIAAANQLMFHRLLDLDGASELASMDVLASSWRRHFEKRVDRLRA